ncbi:MAG TPA: hypothetical protein VKL99_06775 [Candidatus Angelobacter sp.]|nr:hypothetical protein [Candidatus Angelobacter sp.]
MADSEFNSPEYKEVLRLLILLNSSMNFIALRLKELATNKFFSLDYLEQLTVVTQEVEKYVNRNNPK